jgi:hypothetical protein
MDLTVDSQAGFGSLSLMDVLSATDFHSSSPEQLARLMSLLLLLLLKVEAETETEAEVEGEGEAGEMAGLKVRTIEKATYEQDPHSPPLRAKAASCPSANRRYMQSYVRFYTLCCLDNGASMLSSCLGVIGSSSPSLNAAYDVNKKQYEELVARAQGFAAPFDLLLLALFQLLEELLDIQHLPVVSR